LAGFYINARAIQFGFITILVGEGEILEAYQTGLTAQAK
jgi:hypothetical protein